MLLLLTSFAAFFLVHLLPGNPCQIIVGDDPTPQNLASCNAHLGLNLPLYKQYFVWLWHILHGNFGISYYNNTSVRGAIVTALPIDGQIAILSQVMALAVAIPTAIFAARRPNSLFDRVVNGTAFTFLAIPAFVSIVLLDDILAKNFHVPDTSPGVYSPGASWGHNFLCLILPSFVVSIGSFVVYFRILRSDMITTLLEDYITLARSKGLSGRRIILRHAFRSSSLSLVGVFAIILGSLIGGLFVVEFICVIPGLGYDLVFAIGESDYITVQGIVLVIAAINVTLLLLADMALHFIDPRVALE